MSLVTMNQVCKYKLLHNDTTTQTDIRQVVLDTDEAMASQLLALHVFVSVNALLTGGILQSCTAHKIL